MYTGTKLFIEKLISANLKYTVIEAKEKDKSDMVGITIAGNNSQNITLVYFFQNDNKNVEIKFINIVQFTKEKTNQMMKAINKLNHEFRWCKFYIDYPDNSVAASYDSILDINTCADTCFEILLRTTDVVNTAYANLMKAVWG